MLQLGKRNPNDMLFKIKNNIIIGLLLFDLRITITPLGRNICILFYFQAFCKFLGL